MIFSNLKTKSKEKNSRNSRRSLVAGSMVAALAFPLATAPANASERIENYDFGTVRTDFSEIDGSAEEFQALTSADSEDQVIPLPVPEVGVSQAWLDEQARIAAEAEAARQRAAASNDDSGPRQYHEIPQGSNSQKLVAAARNQIGVSQDCTDAVQNALASIGLFERRDQGGYDLGPMGFGRFGVAIHPSQAQAGDILMAPGHVSVYVGDGVNHSAVHGGWNGMNTLESTHWSNPAEYTTVIRLA